MREAILPREAFSALSRDVQAAIRGSSFLERHGWELGFFGLRVALFAVGVAAWAQAFAVARLVGIVLIAYAYYGIGITGVHETSHNAFVSSKAGNRAWSYLFSDFWSAQSSDWWHYRHVQLHHVYTNRPELDPPVFTYPWLNKYLYFFAAPFLVSFWLIGYSIAHLWGRWAKLAGYLALMLSGYAFHAWLLARFHSWGQAWLGVFAFRSLLAPVFLHLAVFNHVALDIPQERQPWLPHQTGTTRNLKRHWFITGLGGNAFVECHLEHHLFPSLSNRMLARIRPLVRERLEALGYRYVEEGYWSCLKRSLASYDEFFVAAPIAAVQ